MAVSPLAFEPVELPPAAEQLRGEVRAFLAAEMAAGRWRPRADSWLGGYDPEFSRRLGERGWLGLTWPRQYGGHERSALERYVVTEELLAAGAPVGAHWIGDRQMGPSLLRHGTEEQRRRFLPGMARGEIFWAIGMSEPDSGSDLASVRTTAKPDPGGGWRVTGSKVWTSGAHHAHYMMSLVRSAPRSENRHEGLSQMIIDLHAPGVEVRPIRLITGEHHFNEVILDEVHVPDDMVVGTIGNGWRQVTSELAFERSGPERLLSTFPLLAELVRVLARDDGGSSDRASDHAAVEVGALVARQTVLRRLSLGVAARLDAGEAPEVAAALVKDMGTRFENEVIDRARLLVPRGRHAEFDRILGLAVLHAPGFTLRGGTNEILRGVVARGLGVR